MADSTVTGDAPPIVRALRSRKGMRGCPGLKIVTWALAALVAVAAAGVVASFLPRGGHRRGTRRVPRQRLWHRAWSETPAHGREGDEAEARKF
ncbi:hypothetical protein E1287_38350 [Actinomadura sp. KC06]|uniref:hypothetical protein n=1 Tax=Actinomadura sp. KC06 TaxID=2530369 RepID=UPI0010525032|nr:hypothetical protein [Actinomadura sp. KC06]TDD24136.1 hypothetical protein E1287_38350 [Actinomadura sp. KC06]